MNMRVLTLDLEWISSEMHFELETKAVSNPIFLELTNSDVISLISENFPIIFPTALRL